MYCDLIKLLCLAYFQEIQLIYEYHFIYKGSQKVRHFQHILATTIVNNSQTHHFRDPFHIQPILMDTILSNVSDITIRYIVLSINLKHVAFQLSYA
ncbi:hypothetical protein pb186bvf_020972 [Paramecium bursaria]